MGTRGLRVFLFRGRYYVYYNHYDSYPSGLGKGIVSEIPCQPEQYKEWLKEKREWFAAMADELENAILTITEDRLNDLLAIEEANHDQDEPRRITPLWKKIDPRDELNELPTAFSYIRNDLYVEWVYVVDLDQELFSVNNWISFDLWNVPSERWVDAFEYDDEGRNVFSFETAPEGFEGIEPVGYFDGLEEECDKYRAMGDQYEYVTVKTETNFSPSSPESTQQIVALVLFDEFIHSYSSHIRSPYPGGVYNSFGFKEMAYAILSFATGQFYLDSPKHFHGEVELHDSKGFLVERGEAGTAELMPLFGSGCHMDGQEPGSAPAECMYWIQNILVSIVPDTTLQNDTKAVIAKAVEYGRSKGSPNFDILLFSISSAILVQTRIVDGTTKLRRTEILSVYEPIETDYEELEGSDGSNAERMSSLDSLARLRLRNEGFIILQNFFAKAAVQDLKVFNQGVFPTEVYANIFSKIDCSTLKSCAQVSQQFNILCQKHFAFSKNLQIIQLNPIAILQEYRRWRRDPFSADLTFQDDVTGQTYQSVLRTGYEGKQWCPVIGSESRPSMITEVSLRTPLPRKFWHRS